MRTFIRILTLSLACLLLQGHALASDTLRFETVPQMLRPGKYYDIQLQSPAAAMATVELIDTTGRSLYTIFTEYPLAEGENILTWDGTRQDHSVIEPGDYRLCVTLADATRVDTPLRVGTPYPMITAVTQSASAILDEAVQTDFTLSEPGTLHVDVLRTSDGVTAELAALNMLPGENAFQWRGLIGGERVPPGDYALVLTLHTEGGIESMAHYVYVEVLPQDASGGEAADSQQAVIVDDAPTEDLPAQGAADEGTHLTIETETQPVQAADADVPTATGARSAPYSSIDDGTFWSMTPGETDTATVWDILTQPITVYSDGVIGDRDHVYLMENPDGTGAKVAQIHGNSQGLHVIGEENEHGYVLVEAFSNYDPEYQPTTDEERAHAFDLRQGYIKASGLKTVEVRQDLALVIDKLTQRMYMYMDGEPVTEFLIATGKISDNKYYNETIAGEYITISHTGGFTSGNMYCDMAIRINGGILLHEVPCKVRADGSKDFSAFEGYLGTKQSHGCVRIQRLKTPEGYNHRWLWDNLDRKGGYKVIVWDDLNRVDSPTIWQPNPTN